jgi:hypothetical protein
MPATAVAIKAASRPGVERGDGAGHGDASPEGILSART